MGIYCIIFTVNAKLALYYMDRGESNVCMNLYECQRIFQVLQLVGKTAIFNSDEHNYIKHI